MWVQHKVVGALWVALSQVLYSSAQVVPQPSEPVGSVANSPSGTYGTQTRGGSCPCVLTQGVCQRLPASSPPSAPELPSNSTEREVMLMIRDATPALSYLTGNDNPCSWSTKASSLMSGTNFVTCDTIPGSSQLHVTSLIWAGAEAGTQAVSGALPLDLFAELEFLTVIAITNTGFSGELPASWAGAFPQLSQLNLENNSFSGQVPASWAQANAFPQLENLILTQNQLTGNLPEFNGGATGLPLLTGLSLDSNFFQGTLPEVYTTLANVTQIYLNSNQLSGGLPDSWGADTAFGQLSYLYLSNNSLSGTLPASWGGTSAFRRASGRDTYGFSVSPLVLDLSGLPGVTGPIPQAWSASGQDTYAQTMTVYLGNGTGVCGQVPPYVIALQSQPQGSAFPVKLQLPPCAGSAPAGSGAGTATGR